jgi:hypothetical protein
VEGHRVDAGESRRDIREHEERGVVRGGVRMTPLRVQMETRKVNAAAQGPQWAKGDMRHLRVMSPPWTMNPGMMRWKREVLVARSVHAHAHTRIHARNTIAVKCVCTDVAAKTGTGTSHKP